MSLNSKGSISIAGTNIHARPIPVRPTAAKIALPDSNAPKVDSTLSKAGNMTITRRLEM